MLNEKQFLVIGAGRFGSALATKLYELGHEVVVVDSHEEAIEDIMHKVTHAVIADATEEETLRELGCDEFDHVIVAVGAHLEDNILTTVAAKEMGAKHLISKARDDLAARVLSRVGADQVIRPEHDMGIRLARQLSEPHIIDALDLGENHGVIEIEVTVQLCGSLESLRLPNRFGVQVITVRRNEQVTVSPQADFVLRQRDRILLLGENEAIEKIHNYLSQ